ncbi:thioredoxin family protein [Virgibacillus xinjiangensis]|uniref:Thioredoxin family protein n=1 Tax=Virgibacillus xinjiangensis TaxID=393090 RepID=A0ABV7CY44_9BACI
MNLNDWFEKGMSPDTYIESMNKHKENLLHVYDHFQLPRDEEFFRQVKEQKLRAIVLTEDWCGDAMMNIPVLLKLAEVADIDVRMLLRDQNLELMDEYLTNGTSRSIPIFIFIDENGKEVAVWGPRAAKVQQFVADAKEALPDKDAEGYDQKFKEMIFFMTKNFRDNQDFWLDTYDSIKQKLQQV